jgi:pimeloyl-ACP methyl ester carboxylesterase
LPLYAEIFDDQVIWNSTNAPQVIDDQDYLFKKGLKIEEGVEIFLKNGSKLMVEGDFEVLGTSDQPVIFKGVSEDLDNFSISVDQASRTYITNAVFERGGYFDCLVFDSKINIFQKVLAESCLPKAVLNIINSDELFINNSIFRKNYRSINIQEVGSGSLINNSFLYNEGEFEPMAVYSESETVINLKSNCWMRPSGPTYEGYPNGKGEKIEGNFSIEFPQECGSEFKPVILIPGIGGSWNWEVMLENQIAPDRWEYAPATHFYDAWEDALESLGYQKNRDYFVNFYDWRKENSQSVEDFLKSTLEKVKAISFDEKYDIIAHSMGGLVTLDYLTSEGYQDDIEKVVLQGTPLGGASKAYPVWEGGEIPEDWSVMERYLNFLSWKDENTELDNYDLIHKYIPSVKELLPLYDYIQDNESGEITANWEMKEVNTYANDLLNKIFANENNFNFNDDLLMIQGTGHDTSHIIKVDDYSGVNSDKLWLDGYPNPYPLENDSNEGDGTVLNISSGVPIFKNITLDGVSHSDLPSQSIQETGEFLGLSFEDKAYPLNIKDKLLMIFACPIDIKVSDSDGNYIDKNQPTIEGAYYYSDGNDDGYRIIEIQNPEDENYSIEITGNSEGDYNSAIYNYSNENLYYNEFSGQIQQDEKISYSVALNNQDIIIEEMAREDDGIEDNQSDGDGQENENEDDFGESEDETDDDSSSAESTENEDDSGESEDENNNEDDSEDEEADDEEDEEDEDSSSAEATENKEDEKNNNGKALGHIKQQDKKQEIAENKETKKQQIENKRESKKQGQAGKSGQAKVAGESVQKNNPWVIAGMVLVGIIGLFLTWTIGRKDSFIKKYFK